MKKTLLIVCMLFLFSCYTFSQGVGIGTTTPDASAALDVTHTAKGLLIPRMNTVSVNAITNPARGLLIYDSLLNQLMINIGTPATANWQPVGPVSAQWKLTGNNGINPANQFIGTTDNQPLHFRINNVQVGELHPGTGNIFWGMGAGSSNSTGSNNVAIGRDALKVNTGGGRLVAIGDSALFSNTAGNNNTAIGDQALLSNTTGFNNTGTGARALGSNTSGSDNTGIGVDALFSNTTGFVNTAAGFAALYSNTTGSFNTAFGEFALHDNTTGINNTAVGNFSLQFGSTGSQNTAVGVQALKFNTSGDNNTAIGVNALFSNTTGFQNVAAGNFSLQNNTTGKNNTAMGVNALSVNTTGNANTATGLAALQNNTTGINNTATGVNALQNNTTGNNNTSTGFFALQNNTTGTSNTAMGLNVLINNITGSNNTALGNFAGDLVTADNNNTFIGFGANNQSGIALTNSTALGFASSITASNQIRFGNAAITSIGGIVGFTNLSDGRYKKNIHEDVKGIDFIMKLRPVTYQLDITQLNRKLKAGEKSGEASKEGLNENEKTIFSGFVAQEVERAAKEAGYEFSGIDKPKNDNDMYGLRYADFVVPLVKAVQEQQQTINDLKKTNAAQNILIEDLLKRIDKLESSFNAKK